MHPLHLFQVFVVLVFQFLQLLIPLLLNIFQHTPFVLLPLVHISILFVDLFLQHLFDVGLSQLFVLLL